MRARTVCLSVLVLGMTILVGADRAKALPRDVLREMASHRSELRKVALLLRRDKVDEAKKIITDAEAFLKKISEDADPKDRAVAGFKKYLDVKKAYLAKQTGGGKGGPAGSDGVSFSQQVLPLLKRRCGRCHSGNRSSGGLSLDSYAALQKGGRNAPLLVVGNPRASLIMQRLLTPIANQRMPKNGQPLPAAELKIIADWIAQGAKNDSDRPGGNDNKPTKKVDVVVPMATGNESVSFTRDIAPFMVNLCLRCHSGNNPRGGLSLATFENMMIGGDSGKVIIPGNLEGSRLFRLVGGLENPRMPQGQARITRKNYEDLKKWFEEGNKFDGHLVKDGATPKTPLRQIVPTDEELLAERLAKLTPDEFVALRKERSEETWKQVVPDGRFRYLESKEFLVCGNVSDERLQEIDNWAEEHAQSLRKMFTVNETPIWKGKLAVFVMKDRFTYEEFNLVIQRRETPREMQGHSVVSPSFQDAYVVLQDVGNQPSVTSAGMRVNVIDHLTGAYLKRSAGRLPDWVVRGTGLALAARAEPDNVRIQSMRSEVPEILKTVPKPEDIFANGTFSPSDVGPVGYTLVDFMINAGGPRKFGRFIQMVQNGSNIRAAVKGTYQAELDGLATAYYSSIAGQ